MADEVASAVNDSAVQDTAAAASAPVEEQQLEVVSEGPAIEPNDIREAEADDTADDVADDTAEPDAVDEPDAQIENDKPLAPKSENKFQKLVNENKRLTAELAAREAQVAQEQELLNEINPETGEYYTPADAERIARSEYLSKQQQNLATERSQIQTQQNVEQLVSEAQKIADEIPMLRELNPDGTKNPDYNPDIAASYDSLLADNLLYQYQDGNVYTATQLMQSGINPASQTLVGSYNSPYKLANLVANAAKASAVANQIKGQKATEQMLSQADNPSSTKPAKASSKEEAAMSPQEYAKAHGLTEVWQ